MDSKQVCPEPPTTSSLVLRVFAAAAGGMCGAIMPRPGSRRLTRTTPVVEDHPLTRLHAAIQAPALHSLTAHRTPRAPHVAQPRSSAIGSELHREGEADRAPPYSVQDDGIQAGAGSHRYRADVITSFRRGNDDVDARCEADPRPWDVNCASWASRSVLGHQVGGVATVGGVTRCRPAVGVPRLGIGGCVRRPPQWRAGR